jgi:processing peptidase subunit beta
MENLGPHLNTYASHEQTVCYAKSFHKDIPQAIDFISDILQNSKFKNGAIERKRDVTVRGQEADKRYEEVVFDHLHGQLPVTSQITPSPCQPTPFISSPLYRPGARSHHSRPKKNIRSIKHNLASHIKTNYTADRMVLVGAGGVNHSELVKVAERSLRTHPVRAREPNPTRPQSPSKARLCWFRGVCPRR